MISRSITRAFFADSRAVESWSGVYIALFCVWCWASDWFGHWLPLLSVLAGTEWLVALLGGSYGIAQILVAHLCSISIRMEFSLFSTAVMLTMGVALGINRGWDAPGGIALVIGATIQAWCYLRLRWVR